jgi:hypothetical protein
MRIANALLQNGASEFLPEAERPSRFPGKLFESLTWESLKQSFTYSKQKATTPKRGIN